MHLRINMVFFLIVKLHRYKTEIIDAFMSHFQIITINSVYDNNMSKTRFDYVLFSIDKVANIPTHI